MKTARPPNLDAEVAMLSDETTFSLIKMIARTGTARLAMRGSSMLPLLRAPMVLEVGALRGPIRIGDVLVFEREERLFAHRVTSLRGGIQTCGDALPWHPESPAPESIVGRIVAVFEHDAPGARRVDDRLFRLRGALKARLRAARAVPYHAGALARRLWRAIPWRRRRIYDSLVAIVSAAVCDDRDAFVAALAAVDARALVAMARKHRCSALLVEAARAFGYAPQDAAMRRLLQSAGRSTVLRAFVLKEQIASLATALSRANIRFALLKGAARLRSDEPDATLHDSTDIDVLVRAADLDAAIRALREQGYETRSSAGKRERYLRKHHHAAPLYPPGPGRPVELHVALAPPTALSIPLSWEALERHIIPHRDSKTGEARLDDVGAALNLAVHSLGLHDLRDSVLLAQMLRRMDPAARQDLESIVSRERADPVRLAASLALAARIARVSSPDHRLVNAYLDWCARREDMPEFLARRSQFVEARHATGRRLSTAHWTFVDPQAGLGAGPRSRPRLVRLVGRALASACAGAYAMLMPGTAPRHR